MDAACLQLHLIALHQPVQRRRQFGRAAGAAAVGLAGVAFQIMADVTERIVGAVVNHFQVARYALGTATVGAQDVAGEQHAGERVLEVVRDQVDQFLALAGDALEAVAGELEAEVGVDPRQ